MIDKIKLYNYKNFENIEILFNTGRNVLVGENGAGKTSILSAISHVLSGSFSSIEKKGFQSLFNSRAIYDFLISDRNINNLPILVIEVYFSKDFEPSNFELNGNQNTDKRKASGLQMMVSPNLDNSNEIKKSLESSDIFPFEYYKLGFNTFAGIPYSSYNKKHKLKFEYVDSTNINAAYSMRNFVTRLYENQTDKTKQQSISFEFRQLSNDFSNRLYGEFNLEDTSDYKIMIKSSMESDFLDRITAHKNMISISDLGHGEKVLLGIESSLEASNEKVPVVLIEEPENHLSFLNMHKLIDIIDQNLNKQTFIATHSNMIASRLDLSNIILLNKGKPLKLSQLNKDTARFFQKAPDTNILDFLLSEKAILLEGDAEYILMEQFFEGLLNTKPHLRDVAIISCGGKTFDRYLQIAHLLNKQVAVITDSDKDYQANIVSKYSKYSTEKNIKVFSDIDEENYTFEVCLYNNNKDFFENSIKKPQMRNGVLNYMLNEKSEAAFRVLEFMQTSDYQNNFVVPEYIKDAIMWIDTNE